MSDNTKKVQKKTSSKDKRRRKKGSKKRVKKGSQQGFAVWRAVSLLPRVSWAIFSSVILISACLSYAYLVTKQAQEQLTIDLEVKGIKRVYKAQRLILLKLEANSLPFQAKIIDERKTTVWKELERRFDRDIGTAPPFVDNKDQDINRGQWHTALRARGVDFVESVGVGSDGEVSLVWPPAPAPSPTLIVGHYLDQIAWISPEQGKLSFPRFLHLGKVRRLCAFPLSLVGDGDDSCPNQSYAKSLKVGFEYCLRLFKWSGLCFLWSACFSSQFTLVDSLALCSILGRSTRLRCLGRIFR